VMLGSFFHGKAFDMRLQKWGEIYQCELRLSSKMRAL
jgi:hypothetical protein